MSTASKNQGSPFFERPKRISLDDRIFSLFTSSEDPQRRLETQEFYQLVHHALKELTADELRVIELRYQHKKSPGQVAAQLRLSREKLEELEGHGLAKLRRRLGAWRQGS